MAHQSADRFSQHKQKADQFDIQLLYLVSWDWLGKYAVAVSLLQLIKHLMQQNCKRFQLQGQSTLMNTDLQWHATPELC